MLYTNHEIQLIEGDTLYMFSDGFADQFGGIDGKKFKLKPFRELLIKLQSEPIAKRKQLISEEFENWRGESYEQLDDVCIMGVEI